MTTEPTRRARLHRFRDKVALDLGMGETVYLSASMASNLANVLHDYARNVKTTRFADSQIGTTVITDDEEADQ